MIVYLSGPISNNDEYLEQFEEAELTVRRAGNTPINPALNHCETYREYIDKGLQQLAGADSIFMLRGWQWSQGAQLEKHYAETVGIPVLFQK